MKEKFTTITDLKRLPKGKTNWEKVKRLTEAQILKAAKSDSDARPVTKTMLKQFKRVISPAKIDIKKIRQKLLHLSQSEFAEYFGIKIRTLQEWEQGRSNPGALARNFLRVIEKEPKAVQRALGGYNDNHHGSHQ